MKPSNSNVNLAPQVCLSQIVLYPAQWKTTSELSTSNHSNLNTNYASRVRFTQNKLTLAQKNFRKKRKAYYTLTKNTNFASHTSLQLGNP